MSISVDLSNYRLEQAERCLADARTLFENSSFNGSANRSYYCVFHCMRCLLALERKDFSSHKSVISYFRQHYIKTGTFEKCMSDIITATFDMRTDGDYQDFIRISKEDAAQQIENAEYFLSQIKEYLKTRL